MIMTSTTYWYDFEMILFSVIFRMMIVSCCFVTVSTLVRICRLQFTATDSIIDSTVCFDSFWILFLVFGCVFLYVYFPFFALLESFASTRVNFTTSWCLSILFNAGLAMTTQIIFLGYIFVKLGEWFNLLASRALFCYDFFSHNQFLYNWFWLEPVSEPISVTGLSYYFTSLFECQHKKRKNIGVLWDL
jgi:hypothetical protein